MLSRTGIRLRPSWVLNATPLSLYTWETDTIAIVQQATRARAT